MRVLVPFPGEGQPAESDFQATALLAEDEVDAAVLAALRPVLQVVEGPSAGATLTLGSRPVRIGRATTSDLVLADDSVSRAHAELRFEDGAFIVEDLGSSNGVRVDDVYVQRLRLTDGKRLTLGRSVLLLRQPQPEVSAEQRLALLEGSELLKDLDPELRTSAAEGLLARFVPRGAVIVRQEAELPGVLFVARGVVRVVELNEEGGERLVDRLRAGGRFGERALVAGGPAGSTLIADTDVCLLELGKDAFAELLRGRPEQSDALVDSAQKRLRTAQVKIVREAERRDGLEHLVVPTEVEIVGEDKKLLRAKERVEALASEGGLALIVGPPGCGKRTFARHFHRSSPRSGQPYVELDLADLEPQAIGAAIFGVEADPQASHAKGQIGYLELVGEGTLAIVHAELLDAHEQSKLATYLRFGWFHRVYGERSVHTTTRVVLVATGNEAEVVERLVPDLRALLAQGVVAIPPLTQRVKDIPLLAEHFLQGQGKRALSLSRAAVDRLVSYAWPGNVKELENVIQRAAIMAPGEGEVPAELIFVVPPEKEVHKLNLLRNEKLRELLRHPRTMATFTWINITFVALVLVFTLYGATRAPGHPLLSFENNPGMIITWLIWFPLLPVSAFLLGRIWCGICPIAGIGDLAGRLRRFNLPVPKFLKRADLWLLAGSFVVVDFTEELFGVADAPQATAVFLLVILYLAVMFTVVYERKAFCRHLCPLAGVLGAYSTMAVLEVRGNRKVCQTQCGEHSCYKGSERAEGCPLSCYPASIASNAECMMCANCLKSCEHRGVQLNLRPPLSELWRNAQPALAVSLFAVLLVGLMARHQFPRLASWAAFAPTLGWSTGATHTAMFLAFALLALVPFATSSLLSAAASQERVFENMARYGMAFIPLAFAGHLAHVADEFASEGIYVLLGYLVKLLDAVTKGVAIGSQQVAVAHFVQVPVLAFVKFLIVSGGMAGSLVALVMIARRASRENVFARLLPHLLLLGFLWIGYLLVFTGTTA